MIPKTLPEAFLNAANREGLGVCFWNKAGNSDFFAYETLVQDGFKIADSLRHQGLRPGERVAIVLPTHPDFYRAYFGIVLAGGVPAALYPPVRLGRIDEWEAQTTRMLQSIGVTAVIADNRFWGFLHEPLKAKKPHLGAYTVKTLLAEGDSRDQSVTLSGQLAAIQFSSGTTADPKPIALSHENMILSAMNIANLKPNIEGETGLSWLPLYHDMGLIGCFLLAIVAEKPLTLMRPEQFVLNPRSWLEALTETKSSTSGAPNFAFGLTANKVSDIEGLDLSHWDHAFCGAEPIRKSTLDKFSQKFAPVGFRPQALTTVYGLAEGTLVVTSSSIEKKPQWKSFEFHNNNKMVEPCSEGEPLVSLGKPSVGTVIEIRNENGEVLKEKQIGSVFIKGPGVFLEYFDQPRETSAVLSSDGWLDTGDLGFIYHGDLYLYGRKKDVIIINGRNYDPALIEQHVDLIEGVRPGSSVAFAVTVNNFDTEKLVVLAETTRKNNKPSASLVEQIEQTVIRSTGLRAYKVDLFPPGTIPKTSSGKVRRGKTKSCWLQGELSPSKNLSFWISFREGFRSISGLITQNLRNNSK